MLSGKPTWLGLVDEHLIGSRDQGSGTTGVVGHLEGQLAVLDGPGLGHRRRALDSVVFSGGHGAIIGAVGDSVGRSGGADSTKNKQPDE